MKLIRDLFHLCLRLFVVVLHYTLDGHGGGDHVAEAGNPHLALVGALGTQDEEPLLCLKVKGEGPIIRQTLPVNHLLWWIAVSYVPERQYDPVFLLIGSFYLGFGWLLVAYDDACNRKKSKTLL